MKVRTSIFISLFLSLFFCIEYLLVFFRSRLSIVYLIQRKTGYFDAFLFTTKTGSDFSVLFGIIGFSCMVLACLYSLRKRFKVFSWMGNLDFMLNIHILLGILGPIVIIFHTDFKIGGLAGFAFWSMIIVFVTGLIGEIIYPRLTQAAGHTSVEEVLESTGVLQKIFGFWHTLHVPFAVLMFLISIVHIAVATLFKAK